MANEIIFCEKRKTKDIGNSGLIQKLDSICANVLEIPLLTYFTYFFMHI